MTDVNHCHLILHEFTRQRHNVSNKQKISCNFGNLRAYLQHPVSETYSEIVT